MRRLPSLIVLCISAILLKAQTSPHGGGFKVSCLDCHSTDGWAIDMKKLTFKHETTSFPLTGLHRSVSCRQCHTSLEFAKAGSECIDCHTDMHNQTVGPECARCHTTDSWIVNNITEIHQRSRFPLVGAHMTADCYDCHRNASSSLLDFQPLGIGCYDCHESDYQSTTSPDHEASNYSKNCTECHQIGAFSWSGAAVDHSFFPLNLGHTINNCLDCHKTPDYASTSPVCGSCHQPDYNATTNPNHTALGFPTDCKSCHTANPNWKPATFPIHNNYYVLTGAHATVDCNSCHNGNYTGTPNTCAGCHMASYNETTNPPHAAAQFPTTCSDCHSQSSWTPANWDHDGRYFPIYSGKHDGEWNACSDCHPNYANYTVFTCTTACHPQSSTNNEHSDVNGYSYNSAACYSCHPQGSDNGKMINRKGRINSKEQ